jgi:hypothetical protein
MAVKWLQVQRFRTIGDNLGRGAVMLDLSYFVVKKSELKRLDLEDIEHTENHQGATDCVNLHFMSGYSVRAMNLGIARAKLIKDVSDEFERQFGCRLWVQKDMNDTQVN